MRRILVVMATALAAMAGLAPIAPAGPAAEQQPGSPGYCKADDKKYTYVVLFAPRTPRFAAATDVKLRCGAMREYYPEIGVAVADSADSTFLRRIGERRAYSAQRDIDAQDAQTSPFAKRQPEKLRSAEKVAAAPGEDLRAQQWDMAQIKAPQANKVNPGSPKVTVGVLDSGIEPTHPDLRNALDPKVSAGCNSGKASTKQADWAPTNSEHGTHVAGAIGATDDTSGITGVAPGAKLASVKVVNDDGFILPEAAICGFMWAAKHGFEVTNSSYYIDPGLYYCPKQRGDFAAYEAVRRAVAHSAGKNVLNVAAAGNEGNDSSNPQTDPNRPHPVDPSCKALPTGLDGIVSTSATGYERTKSSFSTWGIVHVTAPGGDSGQLPPKGKGPACPLSTVLEGGYGALCGTSMASPHAAGVAALLASKHQGAPADKLRSLMFSQADPMPCPGDDKVCVGKPKQNNYYGNGLVNALKAVK